MLKTKSSMKGITLIALVITVIVLLILAGVTIATLTGQNGILTRTNKARTETEKAKEDELRRLTALEAATNLENQIYKDKNEDTVTIPAGFAISQVEGENTIKDGLVIIDSKGNEFVWVPVDDIKDMANETDGIDSNGNQNYQGKLYDFPSAFESIEMENYGQDTTSYKEPDTVPSYDNNSAYLDIIKSILTNITTDYTDIDTFKITMQKDYNSMIESVKEYGGFYVSRYEMSKSANNTVASVANVTPLVNNTINTWYGLYAYGKTYTNSYDSVKSSMIWGSQYDAMMRWMQDNGVDVTEDIEDNRNIGTTTGTSETDIINNIYDLYGCHREWTLESNNISYRVCRSDYYNDSNSPSYRGYNNAIDTGNNYSSRLTLYVK